MKTTKKTLILSFFCAFFLFGKAQVQITVDATKEIKEISPYIYGRNNNLSDDPKKPTGSATWQLYKDAGLKFFRESGGNNSTKYNWRKKLTSHPDWYNNVYAHDWDYAAKSLQTNMPEAKGIWSFQLLGYAAKTTSANFNDWGYNQSQWWPGISNNWCGGGGPDTGNGDPTKYLEEWPADSTTAIVTHWFDDLGLNKEQFQYWNMDNEPEVWHSTHDDVPSAKMSAEDYIQRYVNVAVKARTLFPEIKIVGPVFTNEWQWYNWQATGTVADPQNPSKKYSWVEYFIKRIAEEQQRTGLRLLDVLDFHLYPENKQDITLQIHRIFYDTTYDYPGANGCKVINGGWDNKITKEYIFKRSNDWLDKYMGENHGVTMGMSEMGSLYDKDPNVMAVCYASLLGTFAENNVEIFTPWDWYIGQWEVLHLFTHYAGTISVQSASSLNEKVSTYSSLNANKDMLSVVLVNRDVTNNQTAGVTLENVTPLTENVSVYQLSNLPATETFKSASNNALKTENVTIANRKVTLTLPKLSVTVVQIPIKSLLGVREITKQTIRLYPNPATSQLTVTPEFESPTTLNFADTTGRIVKSFPLTEKTIDISSLKKGIYIVQIQNEILNYNQKLIVE
ncbi:endoglucanase [Bacteroidia bacterium]|nr:endoglucanase [Bacteroidia bacterium]